MNAKNPKKNDQLPDGYRSPHELAGLPSDVPVLLGLSGGADSAALLHMLVQSGVNVSAAHVNHCIRGNEANRDEEFCRNLCRSLGVPIEVLRLDVPAYAHTHGKGLEEAARCVRYDFFNKIMKEKHIPLLATAHNADDNLETLLMNISRGCGGRGGGGIPPVRPFSADAEDVIDAANATNATNAADVANTADVANVADADDADNTDNEKTAESTNCNGIANENKEKNENGNKQANFTIVRPILRITKQEIISYCERQSISYVTDSTNADDAYSRNRLRHNVLPELRRLNPDVACAALRFCDSLREDEAFLDSLAENERAKLTKDEGMLAREVSRLPRPVSLRILISAARAAGAAPERRHLTTLLDALAEGQGSVTLPGGVIAKIENGYLNFSPEDRTPARIKQADPVFPLWSLTPKEGINQLPEDSGTMILGDYTENCIGIYNLSTIVTLNLDKIKGRIFIRSRHPGDVLLSHGMHKSLKKLLCDARLPLKTEEKRRLPLVCDDNGIVWVPGLPLRNGVRDGCLASADSPDSLQLTYVK